MKKKGCGNTKAPIVGIVTKDGYVESYNYEKAEKRDFHHNFLMSNKALEAIENDSTLRFIHYDKCTRHDKNIITLEGDPALDPFNNGLKQLKLFVKHMTDNGADHSLKVKVKEHLLPLSDYDGQKLGTLRELKTRLNL